MTTSLRWTIWLAVLIAAVWVLGQALPKGDSRNQRVDISQLRSDSGESPARSGELELATLGGGCFWCVEAVFERIRGVISVESGYAGGASANPTYREISGGKSGHAECVQVQFDPAVLSFEQLLMVFWELHDPTTKDRQGADWGSQYRSVIFFHDDDQRMAAERSLAEKDASEHLRRGIVTEIAPLAKFYPAERHHQDYFENNPAQGYCRAVISPKLKKLGLLD